MCFRCLSLWTNFPLNVLSLCDGRSHRTSLAEHPGSRALRHGPFEEAYRAGKEEDRKGFTPALASLRDR